MDFEGHRFVVNKRINGVTYYHCAEKARLLCPGRIKASANGEIHVTSPHIGHGFRLDVARQFKNTLKARAIAERISLRNIYDEESVRDPQAAQVYTWPAAQQLMAKARAAHNRQPRVPATLQELSAELLNPERQLIYFCSLDGVPEPFFREVVEVDGAVSLLFASQRMLDRAVGGVETIHADGTFKCIPLRPPSHQLFTLHVAIADKTIPIVYALMSNRRENTYAALIERVKELAPTLAPTIIMCDYERALRRALQTAFPHANVVGCYFHYANAVWKKAASLGIVAAGQDEARQAVRMLMALALLPQNLIREGLNVIRTWATERQLLLLFHAMFNYMERYWMQIVGPASISVHGLFHRTNNNIEAFHKRLNLKMKLHPGAFDFIDKLIQINTVQYNDLVALRNGHQIARPMSRRYIINDANIRRATNRLANGQYNILAFLRAARHAAVLVNHEDLLHNRHNLGQLDDFIEDEEAAVNDFVVAPEPAIDAPVHEEPEAPVNEEPEAPVNEEPEPEPVHGEFAPVNEEPAPVHEDHPVPVHEEPAPIHEELPQIQQPTRCSVCLTEAVTQAVLPCGHMCMCENCATEVRLRNQRCPICRGNVYTIIRIYFN